MFHCDGELAACDHLQFTEKIDLDSPICADAVPFGWNNAWSASLSDRLNTQAGD